MKSNPLTISEAAEALGLSRHTIYAWIRSRRIAFIRLGRAIRVAPSEIERIMRAGTVPARRATREENR